METRKDWEGSGEWEQETGGMETGKGLGREWRMGARDRRDGDRERSGEWEQETGGIETGEILGREWRMGARERGNRDRGNIGKGVENGSKRQREKRQEKDCEGSGEWEQETGGIETGEGLGREWRMGARERGNIDRGNIGKGVENGSKREGE